MTEFLTDSETEALIMATLTGHEGDGVPEADLQAVAEWAAGVRAEAALLNLLLSGEAVITSVQADGDFTVELPERIA